jgi:hypothetical protein
MLTKEDFEYIRELKMEGHTWPEIAKLLNIPSGFLRQQFMAWLKEQRGGNEHYRD